MFLTHLLLIHKLNQDLQGGVQFPTGGIAHEPKGMTRCDSGADSIVWMEEDRVLRGVIYLRA